ncbi:hypothetical protein L208DRAFT_1425802 [Tricholoma matsutake]|nr:hypothetical protein L208DRAFT_1425802 [Tricholoma matsutake 945]
MASNRTSECMIPSHILDNYGKLLTHGDLAAAAQQIYSLSWGPTQTLIYNLLALFTMLHPPLWTAYINIAKQDLSGTTALSHCFSMKCGLDFEYVQLLYDGGADMNQRNCYWSTVAQEIVQVYAPNDKTIAANTMKASEWAEKGDACCKLCGREDKELLFCMRYCQPGRMCQKMDWPNHIKLSLHTTLGAKC